MLPKNNIFYNGCARTNTILVFFYKNILRQYYVQHICHPISKKSINYFACLLYFINYSADAKQPERWISLVHIQLQVYSQMAKSTFKKRFSFCQLNMSMNPMYLNKKDNVNWIFFAIDFLQVSPTENRSYPIYFLFFCSHVFLFLKNISTWFFLNHPPTSFRDFWQQGRRW